MIYRTTSVIINHHHHMPSQQLVMVVTTIRLLLLVCIIYVLLIVVWEQYGPVRSVHAGMSLRMQHLTLFVPVSGFGEDSSCLFVLARFIILELVLVLEFLLRSLSSAACLLASSPAQPYCMGSKHHCGGS